MPLYYICEICKRVPVAKHGDPCEDCQQKASQQDRENARKLRELERKPKGGKHWLDRWTK